jgi:hypothetical protein
VTLVLYMDKSYIYYIDYVLVVQTVIDILPVTAGFYKAFIFQYLQLVRNGGFSHLYIFRNIVYADFVMSYGA